MHQKWVEAVNVMKLAGWESEAIKVPRSRPPFPGQDRQKEGGRWRPCGVKERMKPFSRRKWSTASALELKHPLVMRPPPPGVRSDLREHRATIAHPPAVCFGCLPA